MTGLFIVCAALASLAVPVYGAPADPPPVAILATVEGEVRLLTPDIPERSPQRFERLAAGAVLRTEAGGRALVVFRTGARVVVEPSSRVRIHDGRAEALAGAVRTLAPVPTVPLVAPVSDAGNTISAVRIRGGDLTVVAPAAGACRVGRVRRWWPANVRRCTCPA